jgi:hypothetical protein
MNERTRAYQFIFRDVNQRIARISQVQEERASNFLCECGQEDCTSMIMLELADYDQVRRTSEFFIVAPGHAVKGVDRLVEVRHGFDLIVQE